MGGDLAHVFEHLCTAWHFRKLSEEEIRLLTDTSFEEFATSIPNLEFMFHLVDP